jgi:Winged helix DNA-binding domain
VTERVLTQRELNRALLARQLLLERVRLPLSRAVERMGGIQDQYAPSAYVAMWARVEGFEREQLTRGLERRSLVQGTLLRGTIHVVSRRDYWPWAEAIRDARREWLRRAWPKLAALDADRINRTLREALRGGPRHRNELVELVGKDGFQAADIELVRVPPSGTWENRRAHLYAAAKDWVGPSDARPEDGQDLLVRRYLAAFGPARVPEIASWAGIGPERVRRALERIDVRRFRDEQGRELVDIPRGPLPHPDTPAPPRFIGHFEGLLWAHARRTGVLSEEFRTIIFNTKLPASMAVFLLDGAVAGGWRYENRRIKLQPFRRLTRAERAELEEEQERLQAFHA